MWTEWTLHFRRKWTYANHIILYKYRQSLLSLKHIQHMLQCLRQGYITFLTPQKNQLERNVSPLSNILVNILSRIKRRFWCVVRKYVNASCSCLLNIYLDNWLLCVTLCKLNNQVGYLGPALVHLWGSHGTDRSTRSNWTNFMDREILQVLPHDLAMTSQMRRSHWPARKEMLL